jgi:transcriptional regulator with GAF, ATPase, and Fis domain
MVAWQVSQAMMDCLAERMSITDVVKCGLDQLTTHLPISGAAIAVQRGRDWHTVGVSGELGPLPVELISEALDAGGLRHSNHQYAIPLTVDEVNPHALTVRSSTDVPDAHAAKTLERVAAPLAAGLKTAYDASRIERRCARLEQMLRIAAQWSREEDVERLLEAIAAAATQLIGAERASIFLWDRPRKKLVGRPSLGVDGKLEVDDSAGIVGAVLQSGEARRWHMGDDGEREVNRAVDRKLKFETRSLLAVPMWGPNRQPIGVFEVINRLESQFSTDDVVALEELATQASAAILNAQNRQQLLENRNQLVDSAAETARVVGQHPLMVALRSTAGRVAETDLSVLILGENGTGKEVLARSIHFGSPRKHRPFIAVNCAALVETLLESELFGHEKGAFTDAHQTRQGKFELANGGTLFLDEIGDLSAGGQAKLLRVLEEKKITRVGGSVPIDVDVRVVAATNQPLVEMVRNKKFREDLFFRLNIVTLNLPPLRDRGDDIVSLAEHFLGQFAMQVGRRQPKFSAAAKTALLTHRWPGNIRELRNLVERVSYLCPQEVIGPDDLALNMSGVDLGNRDAKAGSQEFDGQTLTDATRNFQVEHIDRAIQATCGNMTDAAGRLGLHRSNLYRKMRQLGFDPGDE